MIGLGRCLRGGVMMMTVGVVWEGLCFDFPVLRWLATLWSNIVVVESRIFLGRLCRVVGTDYGEVVC